MASLLQNNSIRSGYFAWGFAFYFYPPDKR